MNAIEAVKHIASESGLSWRKISSELGHAPTYLASTFRKSSDMGASNVAKLANLLGWKLILKKGTEEIEISPRSTD